MGGMFGESKYGILQKIPAQYVPRTILISTPTQTKTVLEILACEGFSLPVIFKPDLGERGFMVRRIESEKDIEEYISTIKINFLVQDLVDLPIEVGSFYTRYPSEQHGKVTSVVVKEMLSVTGDGHSTLKQLIFNKDRAKLQWKKLERTYGNRLEEIIPADKAVELVSIGNHAMGTKFLNGSHLINDKLSVTFDNISKEIEGFYFGRFDIRCATLENLYNGNFKILELNGCGAEPAHIYDPEFLLIDAIKVLFKHLRTIFKIARENHSLGVKYISLKEGWFYYKKYKRATK